MSSIPRYKVTRHAGLNPVARAIERKRLKSWLDRTTTELLMLDEGEDCSPVAQASAEAIGCAIKAIEGIDDPEDVGGFLVDAMGDITRIAQGGFAWRKAHAARITEALDYAVQILCESDPRTKLRAWHWAQVVALCAREAA